MTFTRSNITLVVTALFLSALFASPAYAVDIEQLNVNYQIAVQAYEDAVVEREQNADEIADIEVSIQETQESIDHSRGQLGKAVVTLYKESRGRDSLVDLLLTSESFSEAVARYDQYAKVQNYYARRARELVRERYGLEATRAELEASKAAIEARVSEARQAADDAEQALLQAVHLDGDTFHQVQGNGVNCGATSFTVGLNILLHEERYPDNVKVWEGAGFQKDSTTNLALRGRAWLVANGLSDEIGIEELRGDIHKPDELREQLEAGNVVIISSGPGSVWQRADGTETGPDVFPGGHWIVFYHYEDGVFYANDSSVPASKGAGCAYDEEAMKQWLDGRGNHFATIMYTK